MPRLTPKQYLRTHSQLRRLWLKSPAVFSYLTPTEQWLSHDFFKPDKDWTDLQLLQHRDAVTASRPSLPHRAGRTVNRFWDVAAAVGLRQVRATKAPAGPAQRVRQQDRRITVRALVKPEVDAKQLARAFVHLTLDLQKKQQRADADQTSGDRSEP